MDQADAVAVNHHAWLQLTTVLACTINRSSNIGIVLAVQPASAFTSLALPLQTAINYLAIPAILAMLAYAAVSFPETTANTIYTGMNALNCLVHVACACWCSRPTSNVLAVCQRPDVCKQQCTAVYKTGYKLSAVCTCQLLRPFSQCMFFLVTVLNLNCSA